MNLSSSSINRLRDNQLNRSRVCRGLDLSREIVVGNGLNEEPAAQHGDHGRQLIEARDARVALDLGNPPAINAQIATKVFLG